MTNDSFSTLSRHRDVWNKKKIIRVIYTQWYRQIIADLYQGSGKTIELGGGSGNFKEFMPEVVSSDIDYCEWLDICFDAHRMPFKTGSASNLVLIDVLHHLADPLAFFHEAVRVLETHGRIILLEPFPSPFSLQVYKRVHPEPFIFDKDYFDIVPNQTEKDPWEANQAIAYLLFFKQSERFKKLFGNRLKIQKRKRLSCILYPASGGFERPALIPDALIPFFKLLETLTTPLRSLLAFRTYILLEKTI